MGLLSEKVNQFTFHSSCSIRSVWCDGPEHLVVRLDDNVTPGVFTMRVPTSADSGMTWSDIEPDDVYEATFLPNGPLTALVPGTLIGGWGFGHPGDPYDPQFAFIGATDDGGVTWTSRVTAGTYATLTPDETDIYGITQISQLEWIAFGLITVTVGPTRYHFMRSLDGGQTFIPFSAIGLASSISSVTEALYLGNGVMLAAGNFLGSGDIYRSTDSGQSWTPIILPVDTDPSAFVGVSSVSLIGAGVVLVGGQMESGNPVDTNHLEPVIWRSTDFGVTWTLIRLADFGTIFFDAGPPTLQQYTVHSFASCAAVGVVVAGVGCITKPPFNGQMFWYSTDVGLTWTPGDYVGVSPPNYDLAQIAQMVINDDGTIITVLNAFTGGTHTLEVWRSVMDGFTGPGNCNGCPPLAAALLGTHLLCIPTLSPAPCPQPCPVDPLQPEALLVEANPLGGGWLDPLGVTDIVDSGGSSIIVQLGRPTACGSLFANNYCAVAGV